MDDLVNSIVYVVLALELDTYISHSIIYPFASKFSKLSNQLW